MSAVIAFDPEKDRANQHKHGVSLKLAAALLDARPRIVEDRRFDYGERRWRATGEIDGRLHICVFTVRDGIKRIISLRRANRRERREHDGPTGNR